MQPRKKKSLPGKGENPVHKDAQPRDGDVIEILDDDEAPGEKLVKESTKTCLITLEKEPVSSYSVLRLAPDQDEQLKSQLVCAWGIPRGQLGLDLDTNSILLKLDFGTTFHSGNWPLVPSLPVLQQIAAKTLVLTHATRDWPSYLEWFPNQPRTYHFVHFANAPQAFLRFSSLPSNNGFVAHERPFHDVPIISSDLHPYFAICDVALKLEQSKREIDLSELHPGLRDCVDLCLATFKHWLQLHKPGCENPSTCSPHSQHLDYSGSMNLKGAGNQQTELDGNSLRKRGQKNDHPNTSATPSDDPPEPRYPKRQRRSFICKGHWAPEWL